MNILCLPVFSKQGFKDLIPLENIFNFDNFLIKKRIGIIYAYLWKLCSFFEDCNTDYFRKPSQ